MLLKCELLCVARSTVYYKPKSPQNIDIIMLNWIRDIYQKYRFYGYRRILAELRKNGFEVNHKRLQRLLSVAGVKTIPTKQQLFEQFKLLNKPILSEASLIYK